ncbi:MAG: tetratricopeptide repeat protein [Thermodesulfobacteriota bacterium]
MITKKDGIFSYMPGVLLGFLLLLIQVSCASSPRHPERVLDTPELHASNGFKLLKKDRFEDAEREFKAALLHNPSYSRASVGLGLVSASRGDYALAFQFMEKARVLAGTKEEEFQVYVGWIQLHTARKGKGWLEEAERYHTLARGLVNNGSEAYYYMGSAFKTGGEYQKAKAAFLKVVALDKDLVEDAKAQLAVIDRIERSRPDSPIGRKLGVADRITRAEAAGLFVHELSVRKFFEKDRDWQRSASAPRTAPSDMAGHPLRKEVESVLPLDIDGLRLRIDGTFGPDEFVSRAHFATMTAYILGKILKDPLLSAKQAKYVSPFKDVRNDASYLGSVLVCREWAGLDAENGIYNPMGAVSGYDALFAIRKIKDRLKERKLFP